MVRRERRKPLPRTAALAVAATSLVALGAAGLPGSAAAATESRQACVQIDDLDEVTVARTHDDAAPEGLSVGDIGTYTNEMRDADGNLVGTVYGRVEMVYQNPVNGHVIGKYTEDIEFTNGGEVSTIGLGDINDMLEGGSVYVALEGTAGEYEGYRGYRQWDFQTRELVIAHFTMCG
jgi:hypothetical protein